MGSKTVECRCNVIDKLKMMFMHGQCKLNARNVCRNENCLLTPKWAEIMFQIYAKMYLEL